METAFSPTSLFRKLKAFKNEMLHDAEAAKDTFAANDGYDKEFSGRLEIEICYKL